MKSIPLERDRGRLPFFTLSLLALLVLQVMLAPAAYGVARGRPHLNAERTTFVADNGQLLRGPFTSTEWTSAVPEAEIAAMTNMGFNAVHLYAEVFDGNYPDAGSTAPGYNATEVDKIVQYTRDAGMYLVMTIGNGANNGNYNAQWVHDFWAFYAARYADETHVVFEVQNEPVAWGPPYSSPTATPTGAVDMEIDAYNTIRANAPDTPVLLFTYAVLGDSGGADAALTDIHAFNTSVFGSADVVWTNEAVGFHGYAGADANAIAVANIIAAGYPCFMTEFAAGTWGGENGGLDVEAVANLERMNVSWLTFQCVPPWGVSDKITTPAAYVDRVNNSGLSWTPDYGTWPVARSVFENGGYPWTTPGYVNNTLSGTLRIQAEDFDNGGEGVAYHDLDTSNSGGQYRTGEGVDIEAASDAGGGYNVTSTEAGEWLEYTAKVSAAGMYNLRLRVAGASGGSVQVLAYGEDISGDWTLPATAGDQSWTTVAKSVFLRPGQQILRINVLEGGFNLNWIELSVQSSGPIANGTYKFLNAKTVQAMDVDVDNNVVVGDYTGVANEQWTLQNIGGGQYKITSVGAGDSWTTFGGPLHLGPWWGTSGDRCFIIMPTGDGFYQVFSAGGGKCFQPSVADAPLLEDVVYSGAAEQKWAVVSPSTPAFPSGVSAMVAGPNMATLNWNAVTGASSYNVKRSTASGGPYTTIATGVATTNYTDIGLSGIEYFYVVSAVAGGVEGLDSAEAALDYPELSGSIIGTAGSWGGSGNTIDKVFDNDFNTFFDAPNGNGAWVGLDFGSGSSNVVARINYCPRSGFESRMVGGIFQGANQLDFSDAVTLYTIATQPASGAFTSVDIAGSATFRYIRYLSPDNGFGNVAELEFCGYSTIEPVPVPDGLSVVAVSGSRIDLDWNAVDGATGYNIKRSTTRGGPYDTIASNVVASGYSDTGVVDGESYCYVVSTVADSRESASSAEVLVLPYPWSTQDVGSVGLAGSAVVSGGTFTISGSGTDIWDTDDAFRFVYTEITGDCALVARVASVDDTDPWAKGGIMIRKSLSANAANALIGVTPGNGISFQWRSSDGAGCGNNNAGTTGLVAPYWVKLVRSGNAFTAYRSANGTSWTQQGTSQTIGMGSTVYVGLAVTAHNNAALCAATFDQISGFVPPPAAPADLGAVAVSDTRIDLSWAASAGADSYNVKRSTTSGSPYETVVSNVVSTSYSDASGLSAGTRYYYVVSAVNTDGESGNSDETNAVPSAVVSSNEYFIADHAIIDGANMSMTVSNSIPGHDYWILATDSLLAPDWQLVGVGQAGTGSNLEFSIPIDGISTNRYFKLDVQRQ